MPRALELGRLNIYFAKRGFRYIDHLRSGCQYHFILEAFRGAVFLYGDKPSFKAYVVEEDVSKGYPEAKPTPLE